MLQNNKNIFHKIIVSYIDFKATVLSGRYYLNLRKHFLMDYLYGSWNFV